jgi:hypothetical protein
MTTPVLRPLLLLLAGLTAGGAVLKGLSLAAPMPEQQAPSSLSLPGYRVVPIGTSPGRRGSDLSYGTIRHFQLQPTGGAPALGLLLVPVRGRNSEHVQMARLPSVVPEFALSQRQLRGLGRADSIAPPPDEQLAFGRGPGDPPGAITRLQTCITPGGRSGVTKQTLGRQLNLERGAALFPSPLITKLKRLIGLIPNTRWECLAVQLQTPGPSDPQRLEHVWKLGSSALRRSANSLR